MSPLAPKKPCTWPGCPNLTNGGRCEKHRRQEQKEYDADRKDDPTRRFYNSRAWRRASDLHLRDEPLCRECAKMGRDTLATMTDHIVPIKQGGDPWNPNNHQSLCDSCHSKKSAAEGSRFSMGGG
ncbi:MAG TPA: HNH endonuclease, partial [Acidobacteriota bacterium]|nr:HNH endonuclease [Acidobacteriota bacterium]